VNRIGKFVALSTLSAVFATGAFAGALYAQEDHHDDQHVNADHPDNHTYVRHDEWKKGYHMKDEDWRRGEVVDYNTYHLKKPPSGYEWREVDGNYVMAAVATGVIASVVVASTVH
jgi:Ni/Co efflux regulator RcnB